jgi:hypothetical protein
VAKRPAQPSSQAAAGVPDLARFKRYFLEHEQLTQASRKNSLVAIDYYDSDQFTREELKILDDRGQPAIVINRIKPAINGIIGVTEKGQSDPRALPRNPGDDDAGDCATDVLRYIADQTRFKRTKQEAFKDLLVPGTMAALIGVDSDLEVTISQIRWEEFFYDPRSRRPDFKDARYLGLAKWMYAGDIKQAYPAKADVIDATAANSAAGDTMALESFQDRPLFGSGSGVSWVDPAMGRILVIEMYYRDGGWRRVTYTGADILEDGPSPYLDHRGRPDCPIEAMSAYVKRDNSRYGAVWDMIGPQDEVNKRRGKAMHLLSVSRIEAVDGQSVGVDAEVARREAARPDGVIPPGWKASPNTAEFQGNVEMMAEAKSEIERMGPNPAVLGRATEDSSGRALLARQQSGLTELANLYGALEDWELRVYRQCWGRVKQYWTAPQFIRVTDDEDAPRFVGLNQPRGPTEPVIGPDGAPQAGPDGQPLTQEGPPIFHPATYPPVIGPHEIDPLLAPAQGHPHPLAGQPHPKAGQPVLGYRNQLAEMDIDIEVKSVPDQGNIASEQFSELISLVRMSPTYQQQAPLSLLIQLSTIPHKKALLDQIKKAAAEQQQANAQQQQVAAAHAAATVALTRAKAQESQAGGTAKMLNALSEAHAVHADHAAAGFEAGLGQANAEQAQAQTQQQMQANGQGQPGPADTDQDGQ